MLTLLLVIRGYRILRPLPQLKRNNCCCVNVRCVTTKLILLALLGVRLPWLSSWLGQHRGTQEAQVRRQQSQQKARDISSLRNQICGAEIVAGPCSFHRNRPVPIRSAKLEQFSLTQHQAVLCARRISNTTYKIVDRTDLMLPKLNRPSSARLSAAPLGLYRATSNFC